MSPPPWQSSLKQTLNRLNDEERPLRVAVLGIGHELRGDDVAGVMVARELRPLAHERLLVIEAGHAPENHTSPIRRFMPGLVLLVDTAQMNESPGTTRWLSWPETAGLSASPHTMPPYMLARFLQIELGCEVVLLGIQPADTTIGAPLSQGVKTAVATLTRFLKNCLLDIEESAEKSNE